ncbi:sensor histidine kinase [Arthrobacter monumenti]
MIPEGLAEWWSDADQWERPAPSEAQLRRDIAGAGVFVLVSVVLLELSRSFGVMNSDDHAVWQQYLVLLMITAPLAVRRRYPLTVMLVLSGLFIVLALWIPAMAMQIPYQVAYFASLYTAVAWARDRRMLWLGAAVVITAMFTWLILSMTVASAVDQILERALEDGAAPGPFPPVVSYAVYQFIINIAYFGGALMAGQVSWRNALQRSQLAEQARRIEQQSAEIARRAVIEERLRIARELHDVVAHHISVIGVQAAAGRRVLETKPATTAESLQVIEESSREAVAEMRGLLGVLRTDTELPDDGGQSSGGNGSGDSGAGGADRNTGGRARTPEPGLDDLPALVAEHRELGLEVEFSAVEHEPDALEAVSGPVALSVYRTGQESLANIRRHSTATAAVMTLRTGTTDERKWVELETVDNGRPKESGDGGSGYGLRGVRERASLHRGVAEIGPREGGGWRVRVRFQLQPERAIPAARTQR